MYTSTSGISLSFSRIFIYRRPQNMTTATCFELSNIHILYIESIRIYFAIVYSYKVVYWLDCGGDIIEIDLYDGRLAFQSQRDRERKRDALGVGL